MKPTQTHTPGPWRINGSHVTARADWKLPVCVAVSKEDARPTVDAAASTLAEAHANARLIAAAPDLLEALKRLLALDDAMMNGSGVDCDVEESARDAARAAIARAEGKATQ